MSIQDLNTSPRITWHFLAASHICAAPHRALGSSVTIPLLGFNGMASSSHQSVPCACTDVLACFNHKIFWTSKQQCHLFLFSFLNDCNCLLQVVCSIVSVCHPIRLVNSQWGNEQLLIYIWSLTDILIQSKSGFKASQEDIVI